MILKKSLSEPIYFEIYIYIYIEREREKERERMVLYLLFPSFGML